MIRYIRELRLIPIALIASVCLLTMKTADLVLHSSYFAANNAVVAGNDDVTVTRPLPDATEPPGAGASWAQQMFNFPSGNGASPAPPQQLPRIAPRFADRDSADITGSVATTPANADAKNAGDKKSDQDKAAAPETKKPSDAKNAAQPGKDGKTGSPSGTVIPTDGGVSLPNGAERAILERLQERRQELDTRGRELDIRESLIQSAEKRMDARLSELKEVEAKLKVETQQKEDVEAARMKGLITMYENMKPRDAAKIFNGLDPGVLIQVASAINPRTMAEIMAQMSPDVAQRLTVELATQAQQTKPDGSGDLPKIQGQPTASQ
jgi:flagellar motility protein MotE (MotC chaperone)